MVSSISRSDSSAMIKGNGEENKPQPLIPELPDEIAELCLYRLPYPYQAEALSVSTSWNLSISHPSFLHTKNLLSLSLPYLFVSAFDKSTSTVQWQALDPRSTRWFALPSMPSSFSNSSPSPSPSPPTCASLPRDGKLFVFAGSGNTLTYSTSTNLWSTAPVVRTPRAYSAAGNIGGKIIIVAGGGGNGDDALRGELYDPEHDTWTDVSRMRYKMEKYDSVVMGGKLYVTEGWRWPFMFSPRGQVYDMEKDRWEEMSKGMREGWTGLGVAVAVGDDESRLVVVSEHGDCQLKAYECSDDTWKIVGCGRGGGGDKLFGGELVQRPFAVCGGEGGLIYVVSSGLSVAIGRLFEDDTMPSGLSVDWDVVVEAPKTFKHFSPFISHLLYA